MIQIPELFVWSSSHSLNKGPLLDGQTFIIQIYDYTVIWISDQ
jgi:hypothetical protein